MNDGSREITMRSSSGAQFSKTLKEFKEGDSGGLQSLKTSKYPPHKCRCVVCGRVWRVISPMKKKGRSSAQSFTPSKRPGLPFSNGAQPTKRTATEAEKSSIEDEITKPRPLDGIWEFRGKLREGCESVEEMFPGFRRVVVNHEVEANGEEQVKPEIKIEPKEEPQLDDVQHGGWSLRYVGMPASIRLVEDTGDAQSGRKDQNDDNDADQKERIN